MNFKFIVALVLGWSVACSAEVKIGLVDMQKAILQTGDGQRAQGSLEEEFKKRRASLRSMEASMRKMNEEFERKVAVLAADAKQKQQASMQTEVRKFQEAVAKNQSDMEKRQIELFQPIARKMSEIVLELAKKNGYDLVINRSDELILFGTKKIDLTDRVVQAYDHGQT